MKRNISLIAAAAIISGALYLVWPFVSQTGVSVGDVGVGPGMFAVAVWFLVFVPLLLPAALVIWGRGGPRILYAIAALAVPAYFLQFPALVVIFYGSLILALASAAIGYLVRWIMGSRISRHL